MTGRKLRIPHRNKAPDLRGRGRKDSSGGIFTLTISAEVLTSPEGGGSVKG